MTPSELDTLLEQYNPEARSAGDSGEHGAFDAEKALSAMRAFLKRRSGPEGASAAAEDDEASSETDASRSSEGGDDDSSDVDTDADADGERAAPSGAAALFDQDSFDGGCSSGRCRLPDRRAGGRAAGEATRPSATTWTRWTAS